MTRNYQTAADLFGGYRDAVLSGKGPTLYPIGEGSLADVQIGPGLVTLLGGAPGAGKTAFVMQAVFDALRLTATLRVLVGNVEMPPEALLDRQLARLSGIDLTTIRRRKFTSILLRRINIALNTLESVADRLCFVRAPVDLQSIAAASDGFNAEMIVCDYIQRILPPGSHQDKRGSVDATMTYLRRFAETGIAVIVLSAVGRTKDAKGRSSYSSDGLSLASFRESSELEFGADDAFLLTTDSKDPSAVTLRHLKSRNSEPRDIQLTFDRSLQSFTSLGQQGAKGTRRQEDLQQRWDSASVAEDENDEVAQ